MKGFEPVTYRDCDVPCVDTWRVEHVRGSALHAYLELEKRGQIVLRYPVRLFKKSGCVEIRYRAAFPHEWALEALADAELKVKLGKPEQQKFAV